MKFNRGYRLQIISYNRSGIPNPEVLVIEPPFTLEVNIVRNSMATSNNATFKIHNLSERTRALIFQDRFQVNSSFKRISVEAGYNGELYQVFLGTIFEAHSRLAGPDILTEITSRDGFRDLTNTKTSRTFEAGITKNGIFDFIVSQFQFVKKGVFGGQDETFQRPVTVDGNSYDIIKLFSRNKVFVDNEKLSVLIDNEVLAGPVFFVNADSGLLETPQRADAYITITTLFEPQLQIGQTLKLESIIAPIYNGAYKVLGVSHQGVISEAISGSLITKTSLFLPNNLSIVGAS
jgi:hypothetical protein